MNKQCIISTILIHLLMIKKGKTLKDSVFSCKSICVCICLIQNYRDTKFINNNGAHQEKK